jgi:hypothetical protein
MVHVACKPDRENTATALSNQTGGGVLVACVFYSGPAVCIPHGRGEERLTALCCDCFAFAASLTFEGYSLGKELNVNCGGAHGRCGWGP